MRFIVTKIIFANSASYKVKHKINLTKHVSLIITQEHRKLLRRYGADIITLKDFIDDAMFLRVFKAVSDEII